MLIRFIASNFMSLKEDTEFNMLPSKSKAYRKNSRNLPKTNSGVEVLKTASIYGANASGKSNLVEAISYLKKIVTGNVKTSLMPVKQRFRLDSSYKDKPSTFRIEIEHKENHFDYAIEINKGKITDEWLYLIESVPNEKEILLYKRSNDVITFGDTFENSDLAYVKKFLKKELKYDLSAINLIQGNIDDNLIIDLFYESFKFLMTVTPESYTSYPLSIISGEKPKDFAEKILKKSNTGIEKLVIKNIPVDIFFSYENDDFKQELIESFENEIENNSDNDKEHGLAFFLRNEYNLLKKDKKDNTYQVSVLKTKHYNSNELFDFSEESDGTNRLFELIPAFEELVYQDGYTYIVDEIERSMHPILAKELLKLYVDSSNLKSQLIFTTHESHLLDLSILRQDEIWFTEKKSDGSSCFYPLSNFKPREDKNIRQGYLEGRYGGIPFLGDFSKILQNAEEEIQN